MLTAPCRACWHMPESKSQPQPLPPWETLMIEETQRSEIKAQHTWLAQNWGWHPAHPQCHHSLTTMEKLSHNLPGIPHHIKLGKSSIANTAIPLDLTQTLDKAHSIFIQEQAVWTDLFLCLKFFNADMKAENHPSWI